MRPSPGEPRSPTKVDLTVAGHTVIVESTEPLDTVAAKALELFRQTAGYGRQAPIGFGTTGGQFERAGLSSNGPVPEWEPADGKT